MLGPWEWAALLQRGAAMVFSGFNAVYFAGYRSPARRRRYAAMVLSLVNLALLVEGAFLGLLLLAGQEGQRRLIAPQPLLISGTLPLLASLLMTALILRRRSGRR